MAQVAQHNGSAGVTASRHAAFRGVIYGFISIADGMLSGIGWSAWNRAVSVPPPPATSTSALVLGSFAARWKAELKSLKTNWARNFLADMLEGVRIFSNFLVAPFAKAVLSTVNSKLRDNDRNLSALSLAWGTVVASTLTFPLAQMSFQIRNRCWQGWTQLLPFTGLGRRHWRAWPAVVVDNASTSIIQIPLCTWLQSMLGVDIELEGQEEELDDDSSDQAPLSFKSRVYQYLATQFSKRLSLLITTTLHMPAVIVFNRMMAEPDRFALVVACMSHIWATEGLGGFYRELPLYLVSRTVSFT